LKAHIVADTFLPPPRTPSVILKAGAEALLLPIAIATKAIYATRLHRKERLRSHMSRTPNLRRVTRPPVRSALP